MKRPLVLIIAGVVLAAGLSGWLYFNNPPAVLSGDPWEYNLNQNDFGAGWSTGHSSIETAYDLIRDTQAEPAGLQSVHSIEFTHATAIDVFDISSQVLIYTSADAAKAALSAEALDDEWEKLNASRPVGDETIVWHLKPFADAPEQASYRVDFRYLNGIASVTVIGTTGGMANDTVALGYAAKVLRKMQTGARPEALQLLGDRPDLRALLLTQAELASLDGNAGDQWLYNGRLVPAWTPNTDFANPEGMSRLGRLIGYQAWLIKPVAEDNLKPETTVGLFQQVTVFNSPEKAQATLEKMIGLERGGWESAPQIGEAAKGWTAVYEAEGTSAGPGAVAITEISFRVGAYTASIQVQSSPVAEKDATLAERANELLAYQLASALAGKLQNIQK